MDKFNFFIHEKIDVSDRIILTTIFKSDKVYIADVHEKDLKNGIGVYHLTKNLGELFAYFDEHPTMEDARPYWSISYVVYEKDENTKKDMEKILDTLLDKKIINRPVWIRNVNREPYKESDFFHLRKGKVFPDDDDEN